MKEKVVGLKKAVRKFNRWHGFARIYYDPTTNEVWTKSYVHGSDYNEYPNPAIVEVYSKTHIIQQDDVITPRKLESLCLEIKEKGVAV